MKQTFGLDQSPGSGVHRERTERGKVLQGVRDLWARAGYTGAWSGPLRAMYLEQGLQLTLLWECSPHGMAEGPPDAVMASQGYSVRVLTLELATHCKSLCPDRHQLP